jgi:hypothetical protein
LSIREKLTMYNRGRRSELVPYLETVLKSPRLGRLREDKVMKNLVIKLSVLGGLVAALFLQSPTCQAQEFNGAATEQETARAIGHYTRARSLLLAALREFDAGTRVAELPTLIDPSGWRGTVAERAHELERVLDPQPRVTSGGVSFSPDRRLLAEEERPK